MKPPIIPGKIKDHPAPETSEKWIQENWSTVVAAARNQNWTLLRSVFAECWHEGYKAAWPIASETDDMMNITDIKRSQRKVTITGTEWQDDGVWHLRVENMIGETEFEFDYQVLDSEKDCTFEEFLEMALKAYNNERLKWLAKVKSRLNKGQK
jgi:hypothetical protein